MSSLHSVMLDHMKAAAERTPAAVLSVLRRLHEAGFEAFLAGGCVRDMLLGRTPDDYDVTTNARPEVVAKLFPKVIPTGIQHGTVTVLAGSHPADKVEVTTYRGEGAYTDGRRPDSVEFITDLTKDLARRDFTINAMALDPTSGDLRDPFGGTRDLELGIIRAVGEARERFSEDGLRTVRAVRFASVLSFELDRATQDAIPLAVETFRKVAQERVRDELNKLLLRSPKPSLGLQLLKETGLQGEIVPELDGLTDELWAHTLRTVDHAPARLDVRLAAWLHDVAKHAAADGHAEEGARLVAAILERLKQPRKVIDTTAVLVREHAWNHDPSVSDAVVRRALARIGLDRITDVLDLRQANALARDPVSPGELAAEDDLRGRVGEAQARGVPLTMQELALNGGDIMRLAGRGPGAYVGTTLRALLDHVLEHPHENNRAELEAIAKDLLSRPQ